MENVQSIGKSREDYLEAVLIQIKKNGACRSTDVATQLGYSKPSASIALKKLEDEGYIYRDEWKVLLTEKGLEIAEKTLARHTFFKKFLMDAGIEERVAEEEACQIEHIFCEDSFCKLRNYIENKGS